MTLLWIVATLATIALSMDYVYRQYASRRIQTIIENVPLFGVVTAKPVATATILRIPVADGRHVQASLHAHCPAPRGLIVFCPELHGTHWTAIEYCPALLQAGFAILSFDFSSQESRDDRGDYEPIQWVTEYELDDIRKVLDFAASDPKLKTLPLGIFGVSRGGSAALIAACRFPEIQSVVTDSGYDTLSMVQSFNNRFSRLVVPDWFFRRLPDWHINLVLRQAISRSQRQRQCRYPLLARESHLLHQPTLLISGKRDSFVKPALTQKLAELLNCTTDTWIVPKAKHNKSRSADRAEYDRRIVSHFSETLSAACARPADAAARVA